MAVKQWRRIFDQRMARWFVPALIIVVSAAIALSGDSGREYWRYDWAEFSDGQWWRLWSGHLAHLGAAHFGMNIAVLLLIWALVGDSFDALTWSVILLGVALAISLGLNYLSEDIGWYVGLSGVLHGILAAGLVNTAQVRPIEAALLGVGLVAKLVYEQLAGPLPGSASTAGGPVIVDAHLYGAIAGLGAGLLLKLSTWGPTKQDP